MQCIYSLQVCRTKSEHGQSHFTINLIHDRYSLNFALKHKFIPDQIEIRYKIREEHVSLSVETSLNHRYISSIISPTVSLPSTTVSLSSTTVFLPFIPYRIPSIPYRIPSIHSRIPSIYYRIPFIPFHPLPYSHSSTYRNSHLLSVPHPHSGSPLGTCRLQIEFFRVLNKIRRPDVFFSTHHLDNRFTLLSSVNVTVFSMMSYSLPLHYRKSIFLTWILSGCSISIWMRSFFCTRSSNRCTIEGWLTVIKTILNRLKSTQSSADNFSIEWNSSHV